MLYVDFGKTGAKVSRLGMGCMRLPSYEKDGKTIYDEQKGIAIVHRARELGVNYFDTAPYYCDQQSEIILGKALKSIKREDVYVSTKYPVGNETGDDFEKQLETSLKKLDMSYVDFYHFWGISLNAYNDIIIKKGGPLDRAKKAKEQGLIKHISFSFHDRGVGDEECENLIKVLKHGEGTLESLLVQYNILDRGKEAGIALANQMGLGTVVMGPVAGGRLGTPTKAVLNLLGGRFQSSAEMALRFVWSNKNVNIALPGVTSLEEIEENAKVALNTDVLSEAELEKMDILVKENKKLAELFCTNCKYCMPCPQNINIPEIFNFMNYHRVYEITDFAKKEYASIGKIPWRNYNNASACNECGACESKCPQSIPIREQLKETHKTLAG